MCLKCNCREQCICFYFYYYANSSLPAGSSDDISRVHGGWGGFSVIDQTRVVGVVLLHGPYGSVLNGLLFFQLHAQRSVSKVQNQALIHTLCPKMKQGNIDRNMDRGLLGSVSCGTWYLVPDIAAEALGPLEDVLTRLQSTTPIPKMLMMCKI